MGGLKVVTATPYAAGTVEASPVVSVAPVLLPAPGRAVDLQVRVSAPATAEGGLPIIVLSHGHGASNHLSSLNGYGPLANFWAAHGFVVIQPTHLDSATLDLDGDDPEAPLYWRTRARDMSLVLDHLDLIETAVPALPGRVDRSKVAVAGHSLGGHTASLLLGARLTDPQDGTKVRLAEPRITAGVLLAAPGRGGDALSEFAAEHYSFFSTTDFSQMSAPALVVAGDHDESPHLTVCGPEWHADPYALAPGPKSLLSLVDAEHGLGGVSGYDAAETTDESPERVAAVQWLTWAYLCTALRVDETAWQVAQDAMPAAVGRIESK